MSDVTKKIAHSLIPTEKINLHEWTKKYRVISSRHAEQGSINLERTPYLQEIMERLSPSDFHSKIVVMKTPQLGFTELAISWLLYIIDTCPATTYYAIPDKEVSRKFSKERFSPELDMHPWIKEKIFSHNDRETKGTIDLKQFVGGSISFVGANIPSALRSTPVKFIIIDEAEQIKHNIDGEGDAIQLLENRQLTFWDKKMYIVSTPKIHDKRSGESDEYEKSIIYQEYVKGDQRKYYVPCPFCHTFQCMEFEQLVHEKKNGVVIVHGLTCIACKKIIPEDHKHTMMLRGQWRATAPAQETGTTSYHINALCTPAVWRGWHTCCELYYESIENKIKEINFTNNILGIPYNKILAGIQPEKLKERAEPYTITTSDKTDACLPEDILLLTAGVDVQKDRLECSIWGWGLQMESYLIDHHIITAINTSNQTDSAWITLLALTRNTWRLHNGTIVCIERTFIDSGYNPNAVFTFVKTKGIGCIPVRGSTSGTINYIEDKKHGIVRYDINVNAFKSIFYAQLETEEAGSGRVHFPKEASNIEFYRQLTAEYKVFEKGKEVWKSRRDRNEALDCRIYAQAAAVACGIDSWNYQIAQEYLHNIA